jgi:hypothetical protein
MGIFINQPDTFFFQGGSKTGLGYHEDLFSLRKFNPSCVIGCFTIVFVYSSGSRCGHLAAGHLFGLVAPDPNNGMVRPQYITAFALHKS